MRARRWTSPLPNAKRQAVSDLSFTILTERPEDAGPIERLTERTFGPGRYARTAYRIREQLGHRLDLSYTARVGTLLVGDEPYYKRVGFKRIPSGTVKLDGPVDPARMLVAELVEGAFKDVSGVIRPDWDSTEK